MSPGTIYPLLHAMESNNLLIREDRVVGGKVRKYYSITPSGKAILLQGREKAIELINEIKED